MAEEEQAGSAGILLATLTGARKATLVEVPRELRVEAATLAGKKGKP